MLDVDNFHSLSSTSETMIFADVKWSARKKHIDLALYLWAKNMSSYISCVAHHSEKEKVQKKNYKTLNWELAFYAKPCNVVHLAHG